MIYGYARCSTNEERQDIDRQKRELYALGVTDDKYIYWEYESGNVYICCFGTNSILRAIPIPSAKRLSKLTEGFRVPFSNLLISA